MFQRTRKKGAERDGKRIGRENRENRENVHVTDKRRSHVTFLPGDGRPRRSGGLAVQDDGHAVDHGAVGGSGGDVWGDTCGATNTQGKYQEKLRGLKG